MVYEAIMVRHPAHDDTNDAGNEGNEDADNDAEDTYDDTLTIRSQTL
jgi:hypothetical protein